MTNIQGILDALETRPADFSADEHTLTDKRSKAEYWIANGWGFYGLYHPAEYTFGFIDQFRFGRALKRWRAGFLHRLNDQPRGMRDER